MVLAERRQARIELLNTLLMGLRALAAHTVLDAPPPPLLRPPLRLRLSAPARAAQRPRQRPLAPVLLFARCVRPPRWRGVPRALAVARVRRRDALARRRVCGRRRAVERGAPARRAVGVGLAACAAGGGWFLGGRGGGGGGRVGGIVAVGLGVHVEGAGVARGAVVGLLRLRPYLLAHFGDFRAAFEFQRSAYGAGVVGGGHCGE